MGGKSDAPPAPDYIGQANASAAGNLNTARAQTAANRIDQITPYGSIRYTQGDGFDEEGYNAALSRYQGLERALDEDPNGGQMRQYLGQIGQAPKAPNRNDFIRNPDHWASQIDLTDTGQQLLDADSRARLGLAGLQDQAMGRVRDSLATPFDTSGLIDVNAGTGMDSWDKASRLIMDRINPDLDAQQRALDTRLANQGLTAGSEGWQTGQMQFGKQRNDANIGAQLAGAQLQDQMFKQGLMGNASKLQQRAYLRSLPMNELAALRTGAQVTNPTFSQPGQQGLTSGPDLMGASQAQYGAQVGQVNAQNAQAANTTGAAIGAVGTIAAAFF